MMLAAYAFASVNKVCKILESIELEYSTFSRIFQIYTFSFFDFFFLLWAISY